MKCFVALVIAAISMVTDGAAVPLLYAAGPIAIPAPAGLAIPGATVVQSNPALAHLLPAPGAIAVDVSGVPSVVVAHAPVAPAVVAVAPVPVAATSVSATRGAVHVAPLPGHSVSQQQLNLAPAPGSV
ncbi:adult cuticle protein 1-like [Malaya genurostris]|uniref:adult cuticle protein 1-like n=1 Tax=Malaya genurostris TaxID=325434 RepID=UPI0026F37F20|nr:adult cuticle protein 1-like [Malaya genurostris]